MRRFCDTFSTGVLSVWYMDASPRTLRNTRTVSSASNSRCVRERSKKHTIALVSLNLSLSLTSECNMLPEFSRAARRDTTMGYYPQHVKVFGQGKTLRIRPSHPAPQHISATTMAVNKVHRASNCADQPHALPAIVNSRSRFR